MIQRPAKQFCNFIHILPCISHSYISIFIHYSLLQSMTCAGIRRQLSFVLLQPDLLFSTRVPCFKQVKLEFSFIYYNAQATLIFSFITKHGCWAGHFEMPEMQEDSFDTTIYFYLAWTNKIQKFTIWLAGTKSSKEQEFTTELKRDVGSFTENKKYKSLPQSFPYATNYKHME